MTAIAKEVTRSDVEAFLYREAALLDDWNLDGWLELYEPDAKYELPCNDKLDADPERDLLLIDDDHRRLQARVERLNNRRAHREYPHSRTNHQVFNVRFEPDGDRIAVTASFTVWRFRGGKTSTYVGKYRYRLRPAGESFRICFKRVELDMTDLRDVADVAIIL
ncbi:MULTISPECIES: aromatic-ring-hydroxylating dioxygenase subunit beta [Mycobacteriaceae]|jgi:p-cumate 2,3-dioxygenase beta subunit|uniref:aromatic-ring-hydroxylating dioxygenase subunit beta n=1 Tax=Mycobacteriaceae TaxID=1762 RepID=UPI0021B4132A|nr:MULTISPECIES: aromatic-ring-hydroxylating dioxygenase subunit beta [Mycobacteriaceae]MDW5611814.1 aromatic-ring-hydroxylating dioxygenase subunit beta [Mycolicibacterium sp. D5.8-2]UXA13963.1 aromatic-ring-hydroxylating dioxygenase subunit beta [Mycobacterium sp. SMC-8]